MNDCIDLHVHTIASGHAYSTIGEYITQAKKNNLCCIGISDHGPKMPGASHKYYFYNMKVLPKTIDKIRILKGIELNIMDEVGSVDMSKEDLKSIDYKIASLHPPCIGFMDKEK